MKRLVFKWSLIITAGLIAYFLLMKFFGLVHIIELRLLNGVIMFTGIWFLIKELKKKPDFNYFTGLLNGIVTGLIASVMFALYAFIYVQFINPEFMLAIKENEIMGNYLNKFLVSMQIFIEGGASS
ncbi:MAG: DUF4199 domain-containing protein, partial [Cyclobacteriaceae bacterium]